MLCVQLEVNILLCYSTKYKNIFLIFKNDTLIVIYIVTQLLYIYIYIYLKYLLLISLVISINKMKLDSEDNKLLTKVHLCSMHYNHYKRYIRYLLFF